jgi:hypothetical protein
MKKSDCYNWLLTSNVIIQKSRSGLIVLILIAICEITLPAYSFSAEILSSEDQQQIRVTGTVTDAATDAVMPGVNIQIKGTTWCMADAGGKYSLVVNDRCNIGFSFIGYTTKEIPIGGRSIIDLALEAELTGLEEVVVIGYGTAKRADLTGSVGSINDKEIQDLTVTRVEQALLGRLAGVQVKAVSGEPGVGTQIRIRGVGSISAAVDPLYVVDGFRQIIYQPLIQMTLKPLIY